jgi:uncharacterized protein (TIGR00645 family)
MSPARILEAILFGGRWLTIPIYLAMLALLGAVVVYFLKEFAHTLPGLMAMSESAVLIFTLTLIDLSLTANLIVLVIFSGYENFIRRVALTAEDTRPEWMGRIDFAELKLKLLGSITVIAAVDLLRGYLEIDGETDRNLLWKVIIVALFGGLSLLFALTDWITDHAHATKAEK